MKIKGQAGTAYILEGSTNLVDWKPICVVRPDQDGDCDHEELLSAKHPRRFHRLLTRED
jgi:hypothetical protein